MDGWRSKRPLCNPSKKPLFFIEKMLRVLEIFLVKNSSPFFSKLVRVRGPNHYILLIGTIKPYNICYWHFLLRSFLSEIFNDPFHQTKKGETNKTVHPKPLVWRSPLLPFHSGNHGTSQEVSPSLGIHHGIDMRSVFYPWLQLWNAVCTATEAPTSGSPLALTLSH